MKNKPICLNCFAEIDSSDYRCPVCGRSTIRSTRFFEYLKRCERDNRYVDDYRMADRFEMPLSFVRKMISLYYSEGDDVSSPNLNATIKRIKVEKLFNYLDYDIDFNTRTSIIIAPNGFGKTTMFNFASFILNPDADLFASSIKGIPFCKFEITLENDIVLTFESLKKDGTYKLSASNCAEPLNLSFRTFSRHSNVFEEERSNVAVNINKMKELLKSAGIYSEVFFIKTSRTFLQQEYVESYNSYHDFSDGEFTTVDPITICNDELNKMIADCRSKYQKLVEKAKIEVPFLFLKSPVVLQAFPEFKKEWEQYNEQLKKLIQFGLIDKENASSSLSRLISEDVFTDAMYNKGMFLSIYVSEYKKTLEPFTELWEKMFVFKSIIDERNKDSGKQIRYTANGIEYLNGTTPIKLEYLSSGEKNDFIMFFDLIFRTKQGTIVLIDEPEISLHINWQERFIDNIGKALSNKNCQVIISTHSPDIISVHDDLLAEIKIHNGLKQQ